jgi:hypothetical protein
MEGKIVVYSNETGLGKIITPEKKKFNFSIDDWEDYDVMPKIGLVVQFEPNGINALQLHPIGSAESPSATPQATAPTETRTEEPHSPIASAADTTPPAPTISQPNAEKPKGTSPETTPHQAKETPKKPPTSHTLTEEMDVETTIQLHFEEIIDLIDQNKELLNENRRLDFLKMRRFLETAYNNLVEIDNSFENYELSDLRKQLWRLYGVYKSFKKKTAYITNAYEQVFLAKQHRYKELRAKLNFNKDQIAILKDKISRLEEQIRTKTKQLQTLKPQSDEYLYTTNEVKLLKRSLVDSIHEMGRLTDENKLYVEQLDNFYKAHYEQFKSAFLEFTATYDSFLRKMMDVLAYRFDALLWEKVSHSKTIQKFFLEAGITEEFSSITYLKYYLKSLDTSKLNEENQQLLELLQYLEEKNRYRIVCIDDEIEFLTLVRQVIHEIDREIKVTLSTRPEQILGELKNIRPNIFLINPQMRGLHLDNVIKYLRSKVEEVEVAFFAQKINRVILLLAKKHNAAAIIPKTHQHDELYEQFAQYLK